MSAARAGLWFLPTVVESARQTLLLLKRNRMVWILVAVTVLLSGLSWLLGGRVNERLDGRTLFCLLAWWLQGTVLVPWCTLYLGVHVVHGPIEDRTFQYLFLRPVGRMPLLLGKWLAAGVLSAAIAVFGVFTLFAAVAARSELWPDGVEWNLVWAFAEVWAVASVAYAAVAVLFGAYFQRPLVWAAFFVVGLQTLTANLPVSAGLRQLTIIDPLRLMVLDNIEPSVRLAQVLWPAERDYRSELIGRPLVDLAVLVAVCLLGAVWSYCRIEYDSRDRE